jgi:hypothetical protein
LYAEAPPEGAVIVKVICVGPLEERLNEAWPEYVVTDTVDELLAGRHSTLALLIDLT